MIEYSDRLLDLWRDIEKAGEYMGFPALLKTEDNVNRLYEEVLGQYL